MERIEALKLGLTTFDTGRPCKNGHMTYRYTLSGSCSQCINGVRGKRNPAPVADTSEIKTRSEAVENGDRYYWTGNTCSNGHNSVRATSQGYCLDCRNMKPRIKIPRKEITVTLSYADLLQLLTSIGEFYKEKGFDFRQHVAKNENGIYRINHHPDMIVQNQMPLTVGKGDGGKFYYSGNTCPNGHNSLRHSLHGYCLDCHNRKPAIKFPRKTTIVYCDYKTVQEMLTFITGMFAYRGFDFRQHVEDNGVNLYQVTFHPDDAYSLSDLYPDVDPPAMTKSEAIAAGLKFYYRGNTCPNGHNGLHSVYQGYCLDCKNKEPKVDIPKSSVASLAWAHTLDTIANFINRLYLEQGYDFRQHLKPNGTRKYTFTCHPGDEDVVLRFMIDTFSKEQRR